MFYYALHLLGHQTVYGCAAAPLDKQTADRYPAILLTTLDAPGDAAHEPYTGATLPYGWAALHHASSATAEQCAEWSRSQRKELPFAATEAHIRALGWSEVAVARAVEALAVWPAGSVPTRHLLERACEHLRRGSAPSAAVALAVSQEEIPF